MKILISISLDSSILDYLKTSVGRYSDALPQSQDRRGQMWSINVLITSRGASVAKML